ncbi:MAG: hypothetical protein NXI21_01895 [Alphaproteobacteria bacterium]|nr:hypothetical protein [Alphaproteobacteria bacterium]
MPAYSISKPSNDGRYAGQARVRKCLDCRKEFPSSWFGERICRACKALSEDVRIGRGLHAGAKVRR